MRPENVERMVMKEDIEQLLLHLQTDAPDWSNRRLGEALLHIQSEFDLELDDYLCNEMLDYAHMCMIESCIYD